MLRRGRHRLAGEEEGDHGRVPSLGHPTTRRENQEETSQGAKAQALETVQTLSEDKRGKSLTQWFPPTSI